MTSIYYPYFSEWLLVPWLTLTTIVTHFTPINHGNAARNRDEGNHRQQNRVDIVI